MRQQKSLPKALLFLGVLGLAAGTSLATSPASAQDYVCPDGYYYIAGYGCAPLSYYYGDPNVVPDLGFGFFYGGGWGGRGGYYRGGGYHGGGYHGGGYHGGGYHGGGGFHGGGGSHGGGGGHGGGHR
jgi:hypothetical protein